MDKPMLPRDEEAGVVRDDEDLWEPGLSLGMCVKQRWGTPSFFTLDPGTVWSTKRICRSIPALLWKGSSGLWQPFVAASNAQRTHMLESGHV
jgi:hypothetical protein